jgi:hypothetical protein
MCWPQGVWASCGWPYDTSSTRGCPGPGVPGATGGGNWVQTRFDLSPYLGQRVRIRWIGQSWEFNNAASSYQELGGTWEDLDTDDGWWIDDIRITGAIQQQITPNPDTQAPFSGACPTTCNPGVGDGGTLPALVIHDDNNDGVIETGERLTIDASGSSLPGGCSGGVAQYRFERGGVVVQDWSTSSLYVDSPLKDVAYKVKARCSADPACTSVTGATAQALVYTGDGNDITITVSQGTPPSTVVFNWAARPQVTSVSGYDVFRGQHLMTQRDPNLSSLQCLIQNVPQAPVGNTVTVQDAAIPPQVQLIYYYYVGHSSRADGAQDTLGRRFDQSVRVSPVSCP